MTITSIVLSVSQLTQAIKLQLEMKFPFVSVEGEISNFKKQTSGHLYFTLKDANAQIQCVMFQLDSRSLKKLPQDGDKVQIKGELSVYAPRGNYQIIVRNLEMAGLGQLLLELERRKEKFLSLGWFEPGLKKRLPTFPKTIGIVTSPTGAVISDILQILNRRAFGYHVILCPVKVQGNGAAEEISKAIDEFNKYKLADVLIVGRGGGSIEDLWAFNEECVISSIHNSHIPIITAIGHETDTTLADLVADLRAPTPSAAAELVIAEKEGQQKNLNYFSQRLQELIQNQMKLKRENLKRAILHPFITSPQNLMRFFDQKIDEMELLIDQAFARKIKFMQQGLSQKNLQVQALNPQLLLQKQNFFLRQIQEKIDNQIHHALKDKQNSFQNIITHLMAIDPKKILEKGYSILFDEKTNSAIVSVQDISLKQKIKLILRDGSCQTQVESIAPNL